MNLSANFRDISIALAGMVQACSLVEQIAKTGYLKTDEFETAVQSLFIMSPNNTLEVFGSISNLQSGLEKVDELLSNYRRSPSTDLFRYVLGVMHIQKRLRNRAEVLQIISSRLERAEHQVSHFGAAHDNTVSNIADIYSDTISKFQYRIQVTGNYNYLQQDRVANQVRTLLLAAIRASTLWRQLGGSRWQFVFKRQELIDTCADLIREAKQEHISGAA